MTPKRSQIPSRMKYACCVRLIRTSTGAPHLGQAIALSLTLVPHSWQSISAIGALNSWASERLGVGGGAAPGRNVRTPKFFCSRPSFHRLAGRQFEFGADAGIRLVRVRPLGVGRKLD